MNSGILIMLVGLPGSGKSTFAKKISEEYENVVIVSSDAIRKETFGDESIQYDYDIAIKRLLVEQVNIDAMSEEELEKAMRATCSSLIFGKVYGRIERYLKDGKIVIFDATNVSEKGRKKVIRKYKDICTKIVGVGFDIPYETVVSRDENRERTVGISVIDRMMKNFTLPAKEEGFDIIHIVK